MGILFTLNLTSVYVNFIFDFSYHCKLYMGVLVEGDIRGNQRNTFNPTYVNSSMVSNTVSSFLRANLINLRGNNLTPMMSSPIVLIP